MDRVILIKYGELTTKKGNRKFFINTLYQNIQKKLKKLPVKISRDISRMYIHFRDEDLETILTSINQIFGIHTYQVAYQVETDISKIQSTCLLALDGIHGSFKVETKRSEKSFPIPSTEFSRQLGGFILKRRSDLTVDVHHPDTTLCVEILKDYTYVYSKVYYGLGGYPVGTQPRALLMLSGGIDSPVAGYLALKRGVRLDAVYFEALPHTSLEARNKVISLTQKLCQYTDHIRLYIVPFTKIQEEIYKHCDKDYGITIMRRMMYRIMERLAKKHKALAIVNGESIGQVASQTLTSMQVINSVTNMPVIRPVACLDKLEIIDIAKKIDTYDISILPYEDCCTIFVPKHPVIHPRMEECLKNEANFEYEKLIDEVVEQVFTILVNADEKVENESFDSLL